MLFPQHEVVRHRLKMKVLLNDILPVSTPLSKHVRKHTFRTFVAKNEFKLSIVLTEINSTNSPAKHLGQPSCVQG